MKTRLGANFTVLGVDGKPLETEMLSRHLDDVMNALLILDVIDPDITATLSEGQVGISLVVEAADDFDAVEKGWGAMRTAVHAAGGYTGTWSLDRPIDVEHFEQLTPA